MPLARDVASERDRIRRLHCYLFHSNAQDPTISLETFLWAHVLIRSRALDLTGFQVCSRKLLHTDVHCHAEARPRLL